MKKNIKIKKITKRILRTTVSSVLAVLLFSAFTGCGSGSVSDTESNTTTFVPGTSGSDTAPNIDPSSCFLGEAPLSDYSIIYDPESVYSVRGAQLIASAVFEGYGLRLDIRPDTALQGKYEIIVGDTKRSESASVVFGGVGNGYTVADEGGKLIVKSSSPAFLLKACELLSDGIAGSSIPDFDKLPSGYRSDIAIDAKQLIGASPSASTSAAEGADLRIMSFNILHENYNDKLPISGRDCAVANAIAAYAPDVVGLEEVSEAWHDALNSIFKGSYAFIPDDVGGTGRSYSTVFYNTSKAELLEYGTKVYDAATNDYLRNLTWARFRRISDGQEYIVTATHWDINSHEADRVLQAKENAVLLNTLAEKYGIPIFSCGDYNRGETTAEFTGFLKSTGMKDAKLQSIASKRHGTVGATSHKIGAMPTVTSGTSGIDHTVYSDSAEIMYYSSVTDIAALRASDHCPIIADFKTGSTRKTDAPAIAPASHLPLFPLCDDPSSVSRVPDGKGNATSPFIISDTEEFVFFRNAVCAGNSFAGKTVALGNDISVSGSEWVPIGSEGYPFCGTFDGKGHTVSGLNITQEHSYCGLFGLIKSYTVNTASVNNLTVEGSITLDVQRGNALIGGLAGSIGSGVDTSAKTKITSVTSNVSITVTGGIREPRVGGFGGNIHNAVLTDCSFTGSIGLSIAGSARTGGFAGQSYACDYQRCRNSGSVKAVSEGGSAYVGGIAGIASYTEYGNTVMRLCVNDGSITALSSGATAFAGGITGQAYSAGAEVGVTIKDCLNTGAVTATVKSGSKLAYGGGIIGYCNRKKMTVDGCVNISSAITGNSPSGPRAGGIAGVFNLADDGGTLLIKDCTTVGALSGYFKGTMSGNKENASPTEAKTKADELRSMMSAAN
ncbi:MAG: hypothetical protein MJ137_03500 [Clostridia bacterium]|nr:hypothetical protein [Clostridia bacterium]